MLENFRIIDKLRNTDKINYLKTRDNRQVTKLKLLYVLSWSKTCTKC